MAKPGPNGLGAQAYSLMILLLLPIVLLCTLDVKRHCFMFVCGSLSNHNSFNSNTEPTYKNRD